MSIPLTTIFTPPASCLATSAAYEVQTNSSSFNLLGPRKPQTECFPPKYSSAIDFFYSPGVCPDRYTPACVSVDTLGSNTQTRHVCCPDIGSFACPTQTASFKNPWQSTLGCVSVFKTPVTMPVVQTVQGGTQKAETISGQNVVIKPTGTFYAFSIQVAFQASDSSSASSTSVPGDGHGPSNSSGGLDRGAAVGIGVGVGVAVILILSGGFVLWRRRKHNRKALEKYGYTGVRNSGGGSPYTPSSMGYAASGTPPAKIPKMPQEMPGVPVEPICSEPVELPTNDQFAATHESPIAEVIGDALPPGSTHLR